MIGTKLRTLVAGAAVVGLTFGMGALTVPAAGAAVTPAAAKAARQQATPDHPVPGHPVPGGVAPGQPAPAAQAVRAAAATGPVRAAGAAGSTGRVPASHATRGHRTASDAAPKRLTRAEAIRAQAAAAKAVRTAAARARAGTGGAVRDTVTPDSSLSSLTVTGASLTALTPAFSPTALYYQEVGNDNSPATVTPTTTDSGATVQVALGSTAFPLTAGAATVPLTRGRNDITVTVTSGTKTTVYHVTAWRLAAPTSQIVGLANAHSTVLGGTRLTATITNGRLPAGCSRLYYIGGGYGRIESTAYDATTGLTRETVNIQERSDRAVGKFDLVLTNYCYPPGGGFVQSNTTAAKAVTYTAGYPVTSADVPATVTSGSVIVLNGPDISDYSDARYWITDAQGNNKSLDDWDYTGNNTQTIYPDYAYGDPWYAGSGPRTLHVGYCPYRQRWQQIDANCTSTFSKTVNWVAPVPAGLSFSPASGSQAGGTVIRLRGRFIVSGTDNLVIKVGDQTVPSWNTVNEADDSSDDSFAMYTQGQDIVEFPAPTSATTGPVAITVSNDYGTTLARGTFTYSAQPAITSITPGTVANSGGAVITVVGTAFGTAGRPTVVIDGVKSPFVTRLSATRLTAVVPTDQATGPVNVSVSSPQGGGISAAATLTLQAPTTLPTITKLSPTSGHATDDVTLTGTGFGATGTVGVSVDGDWALVTASSATSITFEVPATDTPGAKDVVVGTTTGAVTRANGFTVLPDPGIAGVTPGSVPSYATGALAKITLTGAGFGTTGTVKVGSAAAVAYTATGTGTRIADVVVPTAAGGSVPIVVTPTGSTSPLRSSVFVTTPAITYVGPDPYQSAFAPPDIDTGDSGLVLDVPTTGGSPMRIQGSGFGTGGVVKFGTTAVPTATWTDVAITFLAPAHAAGSLSVTVTPTHATLSASQGGAVNYVVVPVGPPTIARIASVNDYSHNDRSDFDPVSDLSNAFTLTGTNLTGTTPSTTRVVIADGTDTFTVIPTGLTATSLTFAAPRGFTNGGWKNVQVVTNVGNDQVSLGMYYLNAGVQLTVSPYSGLCLRASTTATGSVTYTPAVVTIANTGGLFGSAGTVTIDGVAVRPTTYNAGEIDFSMATLATDLTNPWGGKSILITPTDTSLSTQSVGFTCAVTPTVTTTANASTSDLTVAAGTSYTLGYRTTGFIGSPGFSATAPGGYEYVSAADFSATGFDQNVHAGTPLAAGDWYIRVAVSRATFDAQKYFGFQAAAVHVTITGTPITITPVSGNGSSFAYRGQLGDGTNGSPTDFRHTDGSPADAVTAVTWQYRDSVCESGAPSLGWIDGLPKDVAHSSTACGGDGVTRSSWDVRVASFQMGSGASDRSIYYQATLPTIQITITPRNVAVAAVRADKVYDGTNAATFGDLTFTGEIDGDDLSLTSGSTGTFADATPQVNKPVTLSQPLALAGSSAGDYTLTNPSPTILGTITKASAVLSLAASASSVLLTTTPTVTITPTVSDSRTSTPVDVGANVAPVILTSQTPLICSVSGTTVTFTQNRPGTCTVAGTEAGSTNYTAATAASDPTSTTETLDIAVFPAPQAISVVADDLTVAVGDQIDPTSEVSGLFTGDTVDGVAYDFYSGATLLPGAPTDPGTYKVVPTGGTLTAADPNVYSNPTSFTYVSGTLVITALPPAITTISPVSGPTTGGTLVTITGTLLDSVKIIRVGAVTLRAGDFTASQDGTSLTFRTPRVAGPETVNLILVDGTASAADVYTYTAPVVTAPGAPTHLVATGGNATIAVVFTPPVSTGGAPITGYQVSTDGGRTWRTVTTAAGSRGTRTATITGVRNGVTYPVQVRALNPSGAGAASAPASARPTAPTPPVTAPGAPTQVSATGGNAWIAVRFTPPVSTGGTPITGYQVSIDGGRTWHPLATAAGSGGARTATVAGVRNGVTYPVQVRAVNARGAGAASAPAHATPTAPPVTVFDAPTHVKAAGRDQKIDVTFTPPTATGGSPVTHYQVSTDGGRTWHTVATRAGAHGTRTAVVTGVQNGVRYPVRVRAVTARRAGPASGMHPAMPNAPKLGTVKPTDPSEIAIPTDPRAYTGPQRYTVARDTSHNGTWAHPISKLGHRQLTKGEAATLSKGSLFEFDSAVLTPDGVAAVANLAGHLRIAHSVSCEGYTDYAGDAAHELTLSQQRAVAICTRLVADGAHVTFTTHGYGGARPVVVGGTPESRADNRRVVVIVTG